jgi:hypothetical protein
MPVNIFGDDNAIFTIQARSSIGITLPQINNIFLRRDGANNATGDLNMGGRRVKKYIPAPTEGQDASNKSYVDETIASETGDVMSGNLIMRVGNNPSLSLRCNDLRGTKQFNLLLGSTTDVIYNQGGQPITLQATDGTVLRIGNSDIAKFNSSNIIFQRDMYMDECQISNLRDPNSDNDAVNKKYVDSLMKTSAPNITSSPTMTGNNTTLNGLTYVALASSMARGQI